MLPEYVLKDFLIFIQECVLGERRRNPGCFWAQKIPCPVTGTEVELSFRYQLRLRENSAILVARVKPRNSKVAIGI